MRPRRSLAAVLALVAATAALAGCIQGAFFPAEVPAGALASGWALDSGRSQEGERGLQPIVSARFKVNTYTRDLSPQGALYVISVSDVPLLDEQGEIKKQLDPQIAEAGIELQPAGTGQGSIGPDQVSYTLYNAQRRQAGITLEGKAIDAAYSCKANGMAVRVFGFAVTEVKSVLGSSRDEGTWRQLAGDNPQQALGGMVAQVRCSA